MTDRRALKILFDTYWSTTGWKSVPTTEPSDYEYAKSHRMMFEPILRNHDDAVGVAVQAVASVRKDKVVDAFVASLQSRRLDLRSGLGSYAVGRYLRQHTIQSWANSNRCNCCGYYEVEKNDLSVLNFERFKWGGVRHTNVTYIAFDLQMLSETDCPHPTDGDRSILTSVLNTARSLGATARLGDLDKALSKVLPSNSAERRTLIGILGYAGILVDPSRPSFREAYVPEAMREQTPWHKDDWPYPVQWWNGSFGVNEAAVNDWFPALNSL